MKQKPIIELLEGLKLTFVSYKTGINYKTLHAQLNPNNPRKLTLENELRIRQVFDK